MIHANPAAGRHSRRRFHRPALEELEPRLQPSAGPFASPTFQAQFMQLLKTFDVPQVSLAAERNGQLYTYAVTNPDFFASRPQPVPVTPDSLFRVGSVSKVFAAAAVMTLVQAGKLNLADSAFSVLGYQSGQTVQGYDPMSPSTPLPAKALPAKLFDVTVEELLQMTSGLPQKIPVESVSFPPPSGKTHYEDDVIYTPGSYAALAYAGTPVGTAPTYLPASLDQQLDYYLYQVAADPALIKDAGTTYDYSDTGYAILGAIVEQLAGPLGLDYNDYLQTYVLGPMGIVPPSGVPVANPAMIGLAHTLQSQAYPTEVAYFDTGTGPSVFPDPNNTSPPYYPSQDVPQPYGAWAYIESHFAEGGLTATPTALVKFFSNVSAVYTGKGTGPLTQQTITQMLAEPSIGKDLTNGWFGLGWAVYPESGTIQGHWYKNGAIPGSYADLFRYDDGTVWAVTFNKMISANGSTDSATENSFSTQLKTIINDALNAPTTTTIAAGAMQNAVVGRTFATPLQVIVRDAFGVPVHGVPVTFAAPASGPGGTFAGSAVVFTNEQGIATAPPFKANAVAGNYVVTASVAGVAPATFVLTNTPALFAAGTGSGTGLVKIYDAQTRHLRRTFRPYGKRRGGVRVAVGDVNGDGVLDVITAPGFGLSAHVKVFDGLTGQQIGGFRAYPRGFSGGVFVAAGDVDGLPGDEIIAGPGQGVGAVKVFRATGEQLLGLFPFGRNFDGGVTVAAGDVSGGPAAEIITAKATGPALVAVFDGTGAETIHFPAPADGAFVAAGDLNGDGKAEVIVGPGAGFESVVWIFNGTTGGLIKTVRLPGPADGSGLRVAASNPGTGHANLLTGNGPGGRVRVRVFDGLTWTSLGELFPYPSFLDGGVFVGG